jgi:hypothetical protein
MAHSFVTFRKESVIKNIYTIIVISYYEKVLIQLYFAYFSMKRIKNRFKIKIHTVVSGDRYMIAKV